MGMSTFYHDWLLKSTSIKLHFLYTSDTLSSQNSASLILLCIWLVPSIRGYLLFSNTVSCFLWLVFRSKALMAFHTALITSLKELRKSIRALGLSLFLCTGVIFFLSPQLLHFVQGHLAEKLYFFSVSGPFLAHVKLALFAAVYVLMPWMMTVIWE